MSKEVTHIIALMMMFIGTFCLAFCLLMWAAVSPAGDFLLCAFGISVISILGGFCVVLLNDERY